MTETNWMADRFQENRARLRALAFRMLGSPAEAEDAVQEAWLRLTRSDAGQIDNLGGWLTTVVARISLDLLRSRGRLGIADMAGGYLAHYDLMTMRLDLTDGERAAYATADAAFRSAHLQFRRLQPDGSWSDFVRLASRTNCSP